MTSLATNMRASNSSSPDPCRGLILRCGLALALLAGGGPTLVLASAAPMAAAQAGSIERYVTVGADGAGLYNLPDPKGHVVLKPEGGTPLAVLGSKGKDGRYLKVSAPGGLKVWVFGKYVKQSERPGWIEITGSYVNMRPLPRSQNSYPLGQLDKGDRLLLLQRNDPSKPLAEDWVQVYSPASTAAYVLAAATTSLPANQDGAALWAGAAEAALAARAASASGSTLGVAGSAGQAPVVEGAGAGIAAAAGVTEAAAQSDPQQAPPRDFYEAVHRADALMDAQIDQPNPDFLAMIAAYETVLAMNPDAPTRHLVERRMNEISRARELAGMKRQAAAEKAQRQRELDELHATIARLSNERDPLWGRFVARGWLESTMVKGKPVYRIRLGSETIAEVQCLSGRYDLAQYKDFEIGVRGMPIGSSGTDLSALPVIDIDRIEVISARMSR